MRKFILFLVVFPYFILAQEKSKLIFGINAGTYLANNKTAYFYDGAKNVFSNSNYTNQINESLSLGVSGSPQNYSFPNNLKYNPGVEIGIHIGKEIQNSKIYIDINFAQLKAQGIGTIELENTNNMSTDPEYRQFGMIGKEKRNMINIGYQKNIFKESNFSLSIPLFFQTIKVEIEKNTVIIEEIPYSVTNFSNLNQSRNQQKLGIGFGSGFVLNYFINKDISFDLGYHGQFSQTNFSEDLKPWGMQNSIFVRLVINGTDYLKKMMK